MVKDFSPRQRKILKALRPVGMVSTLYNLAEITRLNPNGLSRSLGILSKIGFVEKVSVRHGGKRPMVIGWKRIK